MPERIRLRLDGREVHVSPGTTVAAMLLMHSPARAQPLCGMGTCFGCRVRIDGQPHRRGCLVECTPGMEVHHDDA